MSTNLIAVVSGIVVIWIAILYFAYKLKELQAFSELNREMDKWKCQKDKKHIH